MNFRRFIRSSFSESRLPNKDYYDMDDPLDRRRYEDDKALLASAKATKVVSERLAKEPYTITCWRGFGQFAYDRDVSTKGARYVFSSERAMEGILWFTHSLQGGHQVPQGPYDMALSYALKEDGGYLLTYPLVCERAYKVVRRDDGSTSEEYPEDIGSGWTQIYNRAYRLPRGWSLTWQNQMYMSFRGELEVEQWMLQRVSQ
jgi:hypothetical protein